VGESGFAVADMFTGIVEETGKVLRFEAGADAWILIIEAQAVLADLALGESIAVDGCCLTVTGFDATSVRFDVLAETRRLTHFADLQAGGRVNLERSLRFDGRVGGHFVTGHIDTVGAIDVLETRGRDHYLRVRVRREFMHHLVHKGSVAIDGISLTVAEVGDEHFAVWLIPHTLAVTNLRGKSVGALVNLEFDLLGKHVERLLATRTH